MYEPFDTTYGDLIVQDLKRDERFESKPYRCSAGKLTIGYGRNLDDNGISEKEAEGLLKYDIMVANDDLFGFFWYVDLTVDRRRALANMMFNLGFTKFRKFKKMIAAFENCDYSLAADEALDSLWAKQVGDRATRIADLIRHG